MAGAYIGANGAAKLLNATIGEAAKFEQSKAIIQAAFQDDNATKQYMKMVDKMAIDSPLLNSGDMFAGSKGLLTLTKDMEQLGTAWKLVERLVASDPTKSIDDAVRGLRELSSGDTISLREVFNLDKNILNDVKGGSFEEQLAGIDKALNKMNITQNTVEAMGSTTLGRFNSLKERVGTFFRDMGAESNTKLGAFLQRINDAIDTKIDVKSLSDKLGGMLGKVTDKAIGLYDLFIKWRKPIAYAAGAFATFVGALAVVGTIAALSNPIALIAMGISAAAVGFKALYDNSETFRGIIDGIVGKVKTLWSAFKTGGAGGLVDAIFGKGTSNTLKAKFDEIKAYIAKKVTQFKPIFENLKTAFSQAWSTVSDILSNAWSIIEPILNGLWSNLQVVGDIAMIVFNNVISPAISFLIQMFSTLWSMAKPILTILSLAFEALAAVIKWAWDSILAPFVNFILTGVKNAFDNLSEALSIVQGWFEKFSGWVSTAYGHVKDFIGFISSAKLPSWISNGINSTVNFAGKLLGSGDKQKSHYHGLSSVPYDGYSARLHKSEKVLTAQEAKAYDEGRSGNGGGVVITGNNFTVREEADVEKIAFKLAKLIEEQAMRVGY
ncbi:phage tail tape measure protein [Lysinibacillus capsici]|uniref:phage tail protein n=1 Tax=Lysinibacillus capsici TaxID=2115968 RepID=UPI0028BF2618|nr:phage tail tape measure protein [Lysinibacillus capsici]WNN75131.1 phage tail tape measure protein [Lysinibacillus capsici]